MACGGLGGKGQKGDLGGMFESSIKQSPSVFQEAEGVVVGLFEGVFFDDVGSLDFACCCVDATDHTVV